MNEKDLEFERALEERKEDSIEQLDVNNKMKTAFLNYAMSVIIARALPDARDGLKPVQRRILYGMNELKIFSNVQHKKSARIVGDVMGKYHPHGDSSIYEAMVRMAQDFSYRYPLVDGHGNFGNIDGDGAAAMRYTEARLSKIAMEMLRDIDKDTVDFVENYDATEIEPNLLPARFPNLLVNGTTGIAVGMATNIPPHNLGEVIDGVIALLHNPELTSEDLMEYVKGPDFPTGAMILGRDGLYSAYTTGNGSITIRSKSHIEETENGKSEIVVTEIPYGINKTRIVQRIAEVAKDKIIDGITDLRDESSMAGLKIVIELRKDVNPEIIRNMLYKYTPLQSSYGMNMVCLVDNRPVAITLHDALDVYIKHQLDVITRRTQFDLKKALDRIHILEGLLIAHDNIDEVVHIIRNTKDGTEKQKLMDRFSLDDPQAQAILDMRLQRLSGMNYDKIVEEKNNLEALAIELQAILDSEDKKKEVLTNELTEIKTKYGDARKSEIALDIDLNITNEDLIPKEDVIITVTKLGYAKRMPISEYRAQNRGGVGVSGMKTHKDDDIDYAIPVHTHDHLLFFTNKGRVYSAKGYSIPEGQRTSKGIPLINIVPFQDGEKLQALCTIPQFENEEDYETKFLFFITRNGTVKRTSLGQFKNIRSTGIIAISLDEDDELYRVELTDGHREIVLAASNGKAIHFAENDVRAIGRNGAGVRGMLLGKDDKIIGVAIVTEEKPYILVLSSNGYGKKTDIEEYRLQTRGGSGVKAMNTTDKTGQLVALDAVSDDNDVLVTTRSGIVIRTHVAGISKTSRATQGVKIITLKDKTEIASIAIVDQESDEPEDSLGETQNGVENTENTPVNTENTESIDLVENKEE
ncbi:MAG: DNA gyrase subunit A [Acholeplasmatales bacterium]|nr:DNA gyrase subunit A [Acholeplasmatales bacterium]